jgi:hypothetical protein
LEDDALALAEDDDERQREEEAVLLSAALDENEAGVESEGRDDRDDVTDARELLVKVVSPDGEADIDGSVLGLMALLRVESPGSLTLIFPVGDTWDEAEKEFLPLVLGCPCVGVAQEVDEWVDVDDVDSPADKEIEVDAHAEEVIPIVDEDCAVVEADSEWSIGDNVNVTPEVRVDSFSRPAAWCDVDDENGDALASALDDLVRRGEALVLPLSDGALETEAHGEAEDEIVDVIGPESVLPLEAERKLDAVLVASADRESLPVVVTVSLETALDEITRENEGADVFEKVSVETVDKVRATVTLARGDPLRVDQESSDGETEAVAEASITETDAFMTVKETDALAVIVVDANEVREDDAATDADDNMDVDGVSELWKDDDPLTVSVEDSLRRLLDERVSRGVDESDEALVEVAETEEQEVGDRMAEYVVNSPDKVGEEDAWPLIDAEKVDNAVCVGAMAEAVADSLPPMPLLEPRGDDDAESVTERSEVRVTACERVGVADELTEPESDNAAVEESK